MKIHLLSIGHKMPVWVNQGCQEYLKRMPKECNVKLIEISAAKRTKKSDFKRIITDESQRLLAAIPKNNRIIALDVKGKHWSTEQLAQKMGHWMSSGQDIALLVGGPEGLSNDCLKSASELWSLSALTFPHPLVRVILTEQLYRGWSVLRGHPYHRG
jgi:23S rRNA (pseudouridine1915-N3)-methyltransferase